MMKINTHISSDFIQKTSEQKRLDKDIFDLDVKISKVTTDQKIGNYVTLHTKLCGTFKSQLSFCC